MSFVFESFKPGAAALFSAACSPFGTGAERGCDCTAFSITLPDVFGLFEAM
jgi:hypothetical protein